MNPAETLNLETHTRLRLWKQLIEAIEDYFANVPRTRVTPEVDLDQIRAELSSFDFKSPLDPLDAMQLVVRQLWEKQVHAPHPRYYGLFNPAPTTVSVAADALVAAFNPQLATSNHSPFAVEVERHLIRQIADRFGYDKSKADGTFTSGGAEANHTALLTALMWGFPDYARTGLRGLAKQPVFYVSTQSHHSLIKAARLCGLGSEAVRRVRVDSALRMDVLALAGQITQDRAAGFAPFMVVATAGTTNAGVVDPLPDIAEVARLESLWFHTDAAWGGAGVFVPRLRPVLQGIERSDSLTFDAHKWLSVPMAAGIYLTRHPIILEQTFRITTEYMPANISGLNAADPYTHSMQWSRRFIGLKVFLSLLVAGWDGYAAIIDHQAAMGDLLRQELLASNWQVVNRTELPVICFVDRTSPQGESTAYLEAVAREVVTSGEAWISTTRLEDDQTVLRACITNFRTQPDDIRALVHSLGIAREKLLAAGVPGK